MRGGWLIGTAALLAVCVAPLRAEEPVTVDSLDRPVQLLGFWFAAPASASSPIAPSVVMLHGCGGAYDRAGRLSERLRGYAKLVNDHGVHALVLDSLAPRGEREICTQHIGRRRITQKNRRLDALAAVAWLVERKDVDPARIGLLGWSNGGSTVLAAINARLPTMPGRGAPAFAIALYPGCEADLKRGFETRVPLLMMVGEADDWTSAAACHDLARSMAGRPAEIEGYAGAHHGFDTSAPVRLRRDVPNGVKPGQGVHVGGDVTAFAASRERLLRFLAEQAGR